MVGATVILAEASSTGGSPLPSLGSLVSILASLATVLTVVIMFRQDRSARQVKEDEATERQEARLHEYMTMRSDFYGEHREGVPGRRGVLEMLADIHAEITPNHGGSMKDAIGRIDSEMAGLNQRFDEHMGGHHVHP